MGWTNIAIDILLVCFVVTSLLMCLVVLMQRSKQEGLGAAFGGSMMSDTFGAQTSSLPGQGDGVARGLVFHSQHLAGAALLASGFPNGKGLALAAGIDEAGGTCQADYASRTDVRAACTDASRCSGSGARVQQHPLRAPVAPDRTRKTGQVSFP